LLILRWVTTVSSQHWHTGHILPLMYVLGEIK
jgi:hypothetical protein